MSGFDELLKFFQGKLPPPLAWAFTALAWPVAKLVTIIPEVVSTVLKYRVDRRRLEIEEEKWQIEKAHILEKIETKYAGTTD